MNKNKCDKGCCTILIKPYNNKINIDYTNKRRRYKAGIFIFDPQTEKVLLVQSKGNLWGPPKGGMQENETECMCAMRELREETGINITLESNCRFTKIQNKAVYFYVERPEGEIQIQEGKLKGENDPKIRMIIQGKIKNLLKISTNYSNQVTHNNEKIKNNNITIDSLKAINNSFYDEESKSLFFVALSRICCCALTRSSLIDFLSE
jgi:ADP-ribose pyrophosphatase YjhB (NUDIX family)